jgi:hypothetical protein
MISYTLPEANSFFKQFGREVAFISSNDEVRNYPDRFIAKTIQMHFITTMLEMGSSTGKTTLFFDALKFNMEMAGRAGKLIFYTPLEELPKHLNDPQIYMPFIEWRLKLGK